MAIPKIIHQAALDPKIADNIELLKRLNKGWDYRLYEDRDCRKFVGEVYGSDFLDAFDRFGSDYGAAKADFFRYMLIYETGGVYLDIKSTCLAPLDTVLRDDDHYILAHWADGAGRHPEYGVEDEFQQWHVIARPKHPFLKAVLSDVKRNIDRYDPASDGVGKIGVLKLTGPIAYTKAIAPLLGLYPHRLVNAEACHLRYSVLVDDQGSTTHKKLGYSRYRKSRRPIVRSAHGTSMAHLLRRFFG